MATTNLQPEADEVGRLERKDQFYGFQRYISRISFDFGSVVQIFNANEGIKEENRRTRSKVSSSTSAELEMAELCGEDPELLRIYKQEKLKERLKDIKKAQEDRQKFAFMLDSRLGKDIRRLLRDTDYQTHMNKFKIEDMWA